MIKSNQFIFKTSFNFTCLSSLPIYKLPSNLKSQLIPHLNPQSNAKLIEVYPVFEPHNWSSITYILCFHQTSSTPLLPLQSLPSSPISFPIPLKLFSPSKSTTTHHALKSLTSIIPSPRPFSGRAILLDGIPKKLSHHHVNNSLLRLGYPIITPPSQSSWSISTSHSDQPLLTRYQIVYVNSVALAHHMAGQLHRSRPAWLPSSTSQHLQSQHASSTANEDGDGTGWELKARVLY